MIASEDDMNDRIRFLESEMAGEKVVTRHILEMAQRDGADIAAVRVDITRLELKVDRTANDVAVVKGAQMGQGTMLNILVQDVREMRTEMGQMRMEMRTEMGQMRTEVRTEMGQMRAEMGQMRTEMRETRARLDAMERTMDARFDAVLAAIRPLAPHTPPAL